MDGDRFLEKSVPCIPVKEIRILTHPFLLVVALPTDKKPSDMASLYV